jgi:hypothetical protein
MRPLAASTILRMAQRAQRVAPVTEDPPLDPEAIDRAYRVHRARRRMKIERRRERARARLRFTVVVLLLIGLAVTLVVVLWRELQNVFGL